MEAIASRLEATAHRSDVHDTLGASDAPAPRASLNALETSTASFWPKSGSMSGMQPRLIQQGCVAFETSLLFLVAFCSVRSKARSAPFVALLFRSSRDGLQPSRVTTVSSSWFDAPRKMHLCRHCQVEARCLMRPTQTQLDFRMNVAFDGTFYESQV